MAGHSYKESKRIVLKTILILGGITLVEVLLALAGKGYLVPGMEWNMYFVGFFMITLSLAKAYLIVFEFMHMKYEAKGLVRSVLLPTLLLVWGVIAFLWDGNTWGERRLKDSGTIEIVLPEGDSPTEGHPGEGADTMHMNSGSEEGTHEGSQDSGSGGH